MAYPGAIHTDRARSIVDSTVATSARRRAWGPLEGPPLADAVTSLPGIQLAAHSPRALSEPLRAATDPALTGSCAAHSTIPPVAESTMRRMDTALDGRPSTAATALRTVTP